MRDAYCSVCLGQLDEAPQALETRQPLHDCQVGPAPSRGFSLLLIVSGLIAQFPAAFALTRGDMVEAVYTGGGGLALVIVGLLWRARPNPNSTRLASSGTPFWVALLVVGCLVGIGLLSGAIQIRREKPLVGQAETAGVFEQGGYRNTHLGFRVRFGEGWEEVTVAARQQGRMMSRENVNPSAILLALAWASPDRPGDNASVMFAVESISGADGIATGHDYLRQALHRLGQRAEPPRDVIEEPGITLAGLAFDRLSLKRSWEGRELGMTFWVALTRGYALIVTGTYESPSGLRAIESLLTRVSATRAE